MYFVIHYTVIHYTVIHYTLIHYNVIYYTVIHSTVIHYTVQWLAFRSEFGEAKYSHFFIGYGVAEKFWFEKVWSVSPRN